MLPGREVPRSATLICSGRAFQPRLAPRCSAVRKPVKPKTVQGTQGQQSPFFRPPGLLTDFPTASNGLQEWSDIISGFLDSSKRGNVEYEIDLQPRPQFFNASKQPLSSDHKTKVISWQAFPKNVRSSASSQRAAYKKADSTRSVQDEYCEWSVARNDEGKIAKITLTSEGPEYWQFLASSQPDTVVELYQKFVNPSVKKADLFQGGKYVQGNKWNKDTKNGAMHLVQVNNTLSAEIELAAGASVVREINGKYLTDDQDLIRCGRYGNPGRFSDPSIGAAVNELARAGADVTLADPIALYIDSFNPTGFQTPDGTDARDFWKIVRGSNELGLRAEFEVPSNKSYVVGDIQILSQSDMDGIEYGSQIIEFVRIKLTGVADNIGKDLQPATSCVKDKPTGNLSSTTGPDGFDFTTRFM